MSLTQYIVSPGCTSKQWTMSCAALDREAAVRVHRALRPPGRARGVDDHQRLVGAGLRSVSQRV